MFVGVLGPWCVLALLLVEAERCLPRQLPRARPGRIPATACWNRCSIVSAAVTLVAFAIWFVFLAGAKPRTGNERPRSDQRADPSGAWVMLPFAL